MTSVFNLSSLFTFTYILEGKSRSLQRKKPSFVQCTLFFKKITIYKRKIPSYQMRLLTELSWRYNQPSKPAGRSRPALTPMPPAPAPRVHASKLYPDSDKCDSNIKSILFRGTLIFTPRIFLYLHCKHAPTLIRIPIMEAAKKWSDH